MITSGERQKIPYKVKSEDTDKQGVKDRYSCNCEKELPDRWYPVVSDPPETDTAEIQFDPDPGCIRFL